MDIQVQRKHFLVYAELTYQYRNRHVELPNHVHNLNVLTLINYSTMELKYFDYFQQQQKKNAEIFSFKKILTRNYF